MNLSDNFTFLGQRDRTFKVYVITYGVEGWLCTMPGKLFGGYKVLYCGDGILLLCMDEAPPGEIVERALAAILE